MYFQFGCLGGVPEEEYHDGGERIARCLAEQVRRTGAGTLDVEDVERFLAASAFSQSCQGSSSRSPVWMA